MSWWSFRPSPLEIMQRRIEFIEANQIFFKTQAFETPLEASLVGLFAFLFWIEMILMNEVFQMKEP